MKPVVAQIVIGCGLVMIDPTINKNMATYTQQANISKEAPAD